MDILRSLAGDGEPLAIALSGSAHLGSIGNLPRYVGVCAAISGDTMNDAEQ
jgi:hypothetical protein